MECSVSGASSARRLSSAYPRIAASGGDELPQPHLAVLARCERAAHVVEHLVERRCDLVDLRAGVDVADPLDELDLAAVQGQRADLRRRVGHALERAELPAHQHRTRDSGADQREADDDHFDQHEAVDDVLGLARGLPEDVGRSAGLGGHHAVGAQRQVRAGRTPVCGQRGEQRAVGGRQRRRAATP